jgi:beta-xylosidase
MSHIGNRYGQSVTDDWYIELWFDEAWRHRRDKEAAYLELFDTTRRIIKEFNDKIRVGGYGIRMDWGEDVRLEFLQKWNSLPCRPDFLTASYYSYVRGEDGLDKFARRSTDREQLLHLISRERQVLSEAGMEDIPFYLNEWNLTPSVRNYINDSTFKGAYILKNVIDLCGVVNGMGYGAGSDLQFISYDTAGELFGGNGLITRDSILKPAAFAFDFLNRLFPYYIGKTGNFLITTDRHDNYAIICHNQQNLNYNYYLTDEWDIDKNNLWKYFEDRKKLHIQIRLKGVTDGAYRVKVYRINDQNGSVLNIWKELEYEQDLSRNDIKYFRRVCEPNLKIHQAVAENGELMVEDELLPNEITFIRIRRRR